MGRGTVNISLNNNDTYSLKNVICSENLSFNLLSLRRLVEQGLTVYLDKEIINIFDPKISEIFLSGIYNKPFWELELKILNANENGKVEYSPKYNTDVVNVNLVDNESQRRVITITTLGQIPHKREPVRPI